VLVLWRAFGLTEISHTFCYENWQFLMNESAFHICGRWILITTVFHFQKSTSTGGIPDFFRVCRTLKLSLQSLTYLTPLKGFRGADVHRKKTWILRFQKDCLSHPNKISSTQPIYLDQVIYGQFSVKTPNFQRKFHSV
jgi:hypothetical protein